MANSNKPSGKAAGATSRTKSAPSGKESTKSAPNNEKSVYQGWLQDVSIEVPVPAHADFIPGDRELEFSVGLRQQEANGFLRSELRARALIHSQGSVLALVEASFVNVEPATEEPRPNLAAELYEGLRPNLEKMLAFAGHTPPLPASLDKIA